MATASMEMLGRGANASRSLYLPPIVARLALGASYANVNGEVHVTLDGERPMAMSEEDFALAARAAARLRKALPRSISSAALIDAVMEAHRLICDEMFAPGTVRVLYFPAHAPGSMFYRCLLPSVALNQGTRVRAFVSSNKVAREAADYDVVVFQIDHSPLAVALARTLKAEGKCVVYEIDDAFDALEDWHLQGAHYRDDGTRERILEMMGLADAVTVTTARLAERYAKHAKRVEVVPNAVPVMDWPRAASGRPDSFRVLWAGSPSHFGDLQVVGEALSRFARACPSATLVFFGREPVGLDVPESQVEVHGFVDFSEYPAKLAELAADVAIAPLADVPFNQCKSNVKVLEYWATGYPVVASDVGPYKDTITAGQNGLLCLSQYDWFDALKAIRMDPGLRARLAEGGRASVREHDVDRLAGRVEEFFVGLAEAKT